jgi:hypothetical protein
MKSTKKIFAFVFLSLAALILIVYLCLYFFVGIDYLILNKVFSKEDLIVSSADFKAKTPLLIQEEYIEEYGKGRFPKYKIYNTEGIRLDIYECYESLYDLPKVIQANSTNVIKEDTLANEISKIRSVDGSDEFRSSALVKGKYSLLFYYKIGMNRLQIKRLENVINHRLGIFSDSLNLVIVNVDKVSF